MKAGILSVTFSFVELLKQLVAVIPGLFKVVRHKENGTVRLLGVECPEEEGGVLNLRSKLMNGNAQLNS